MKKVLLLWLTMGLMAGPAAAAMADDWLTLTGDPVRADRDTVQVNPVAVAREADSVTLQLRVNRAQPRTNWHGVPYRSYAGLVRIRCQERRGEYLSLRMFEQALWTGAAQEAIYAEPYPPVRFRDMQPNPTERIIRAACVAH